MYALTVYCMFNPTSDYNNRIVFEDNNHFGLNEWTNKNKLLATVAIKIINIIYGA